MMYWVRRVLCVIADAYEFNKRYWRGLIVRAIEDALVLLLLCIAIRLICTILGGVFDALGVSYG